MKITEVINHLKKLESWYGDLDVCTYDNLYKVRVELEPINFSIDTELNVLLIA